MIGVFHRQLQASRRSPQPMSHQTIKPLEPVLGEEDAMAWEASKAAVDVPHSTIVFQRQPSLRWHKPLALQLLPDLTEEPRRRRT
jgi:hypothetical protein